MSTSLASTIEHILQEEGFKVDKVQPIVPSDIQEEDQVSTFRILVKGQHAEWASMIRSFEQTQRILVYSLLPQTIDESIRPRISELICRINYGLILGNFEMDWEDGELRYKTSMDVEDIEVSRTVLRNLVYGNFHSFDMYFDAIQQGINTERDLDIIVLEAENPNIPKGFDLVDEIVH